MGNDLYGIFRERKGPPSPAIGLDGICIFSGSIDDKIYFCYVVWTGYLNFYIDGADYQGYCEWPLEILEER